MNIKKLLEDYISDIELILDYNDKFGGIDEDYYNELLNNLEQELDNIRKREAYTTKYGGINDKSIKL